MTTAVRRSDNPFYRRRAPHRRRSRREHTEDLRVRPAQQLRHGLRSESGNLWEQENGDDSFSELNRVQPGFNSGWVPDHGAARRRIRAVQGDRDHRDAEPAGPVRRHLLRSAAASVVAGEYRRYSGSSAVASLHAAGRPLTASPSSPGSSRWRRGDWLCRTAAGSAAGIDGDLFVAAARPFLEGGHLFHFILTGRPQRIASDGSAARGSRRRQPAQVGDHREREAADRHGTSASAPTCRRDRTGTSSSCR